MTLFFIAEDLIPDVYIENGVKTRCASWILLKLLDVIDLMHRVPKQRSQPFWQTDLLEDNFFRDLG